MCLKTPSPELLEEEKQIQVTINNYIDEFKHIKFNAGAGAGKTHALKERIDCTSFGHRGTAVPQNAVTRLQQSH